MTSVSQDFCARNAGKIAETITKRGSVYAPPEVNFDRIAEAWRMWIRWRFGADVELTTMDVGMMQALIKMSRQSETPHHEDSALDGAAYWLLAVGCQHDLMAQEAAK